MKRVIISGGGTGGHLFPALAIADALRELEPSVELLFVGARGRIEMERVPKAGYRIEGLDIQGLHRRITWSNLLFPVKLLKSMWKSNRIIQEFKPHVAVGVGGYASGPLLLAAGRRSEEHTSELQSLMRISYAVFCLKKKKTIHKYCSWSIE